MFIDFLLALLPILWLIIAMSLLKQPAFKACPVALVIAVILAMIKWAMPVKDMATAALEGALMALWPICLVIVAAVFVYNLCCYTHAMDIIQNLLTSVSQDKRILLLIIGWGFGAFMEGMAGFGTAVAIPASMLVGLGFNPIIAVVACLVANSTPTSFGSVGIPTTTLATITGLPGLSLAWNTTVQFFLLVILSPICMIIIYKGFKALKGIWGFTLLAGLSLGLTQLIISYFLGPELPDIIGSLVSLGLMILVARKRKGEVPEEYRVEAKDVSTQKIDLHEALVACLPFILIFVFLLCSSKMIPPIYNMLNSVKTSVVIYSGEGASASTFSWISTPGVLILIAAFIGGAVQKASMGEIFGVLGDTLKQMSKTIITIVCIVAMAKIMGYSGMIAAIAAMLVAITGSFYPIVAPFVGALGAFVTGSGTSTSVLFGELQVQTAQAIGVSPDWLAAANSVGADIGKMVSPQNIAIGAAATNLIGRESEILAKVFKWFLGFIIIAGIICYIGSLILA